MKRSVMLNECKDGGLKMLDIRSFNYALKSKWVKKYLDDNNQAKWKLFFDFFSKQHDSKLLLTGNLKQADVAGLQIQDSFTKEVIEIWSNLTHEENPTHCGNAQFGTTLLSELETGQYFIWIGLVQELIRPKTC